MKHDMCITLPEVKETIETSLKLALAETIKPDLAAIKAQTTLTNGRVNKLESVQEDLEEEIQAIKENLLAHPNTCPYGHAIRKLEDANLSDTSVKTFLWKAVAIMIAFMGLGFTALAFFLK
jgi:hypothetical protein